jgi:hypothetical protein
MDLHLCRSLRRAAQAQILKISCELVHTGMDRAPPLLPSASLLSAKVNAMVTILVLGSILAAALLMMAVAGSTMAPNP